MKITAIVPVKKNSSRLPKKNLLPFGNDNLLVHKLKQLKQSELIDDIIVSSDSDKILNISSKNGVGVDKRPLKYTLDETPFGDFVEYICKKSNADYILWACVTSPLIDNYDYDEAIRNFMVNQDKYDSIVSLYKFKHYLFNEDGPLNFKLGSGHVYSQNLPNLYLYTNGINFASRKNMLKWKYNFGKKPYRFFVNQEKAIDIDTYYDYITAKAFYEDRKLSN